MKRFSIIIPTLQKENRILNKLISQLSEDDSVDEIILIDNSCKGYFFNSSKLRVIVPNKNLYVNPSWNLGIKEAKNEFFGILNDDLLLPKNLCSQVLEFLNNNNCGLIGLDNDTLIPTKSIQEFNDNPENMVISFKKMDEKFNSGYWGSIIFGSCKNYKSIPEELKIYCGDNFLYKSTRDKDNYKMCGIKIKHYGSLSSDLEIFNNIKKDDMQTYSKMDSEYKAFIKKIIISQNKKIKTLNPSFVEKIFSIKNEYQQNCKHKVVRFFCIKIKFRWR